VSQTFNHNFTHRRNVHLLLAVLWPVHQQASAHAAHVFTCRAVIDEIAAEQHYLTRLDLAFVAVRVGGEASWTDSNVIVLSVHGIKGWE
jgi:hypothetical protein